MTKQLLTFLLLGATLAQAQTSSTPLKVGDTVPNVTLRTEDDKEVNLRKLVSEKPTVLIFYRGGWRPFCNRHLQALAGIEDDLNKAGAQGGEPTERPEAELARMMVTVQEKFPGVPQLSTTNLAAWLADPARPQPELLDVRPPKGFAVSHLPGAQRVSPGAKAAAVLAKLDFGQPVVVYCSVGYRSSQTAQRLQRAGLTNVMNLEGSIFAWANEDRPLEKDGQPAQQVHPYNQRYGRMLQPARRAPVQ